MDRYRISWPDYFDELAGELEAKGWNGEVGIEIDNQMMMPEFITQARLMGEMSEDISREGYFFRPDMIVVDRLCRQSIQDAVEKLARSGRLSILARISDNRASVDDEKPPSAQ